MNKKRRAIYEKTGGRCFYCGCELGEKGWHADHVEAIIRNWWTNTCERPELDTEDNKVPACASCNLMKAQLSVEGFRSKITKFVQSLNLYSNQYKLAKRYGLVQETGGTVQFWFERQGGSES